MVLPGLGRCSNIATVLPRITSELFFIALVFQVWRGRPHGTRCLVTTGSHRRAKNCRRAAGHLRYLERRSVAGPPNRSRSMASTMRRIRRRRTRAWKKSSPAGCSMPRFPRPPDDWSTARPGPHKRVPASSPIRRKAGFTPRAGCRRLPRARPAWIPVSRWAKVPSPATIRST